MLLFYNDVVNGQNITTTPRWIGINGISKSLSDTSNALTVISNEAKKISSSSDPWTTTDPPNFEKNLSDAYGTYGSSNLPNPNPAASQNGGASSITPLYIKNYGNYTKDSTILNSIFKEYSTKISASISFINQAKGAASNISSYENKIQSQLQSAKDNIDSFNSTFTSVGTTFDGIVSIVNI